MIANDEFPLNTSAKKAVATADGQLKASKIPANIKGVNKIPTRDNRGMNTKIKNNATKIILKLIFLKPAKSIFKIVKNISVIKK